MTGEADDYIERALLILATEFNLFLYHMDEGWIITSSYAYENDGRLKSGWAMRTGKPGAASKCRPTIREAIQLTLIELEEKALQWQTEGQAKIERCMALRLKVSQINAT